MLMPVVLYYKAKFVYVLFVLSVSQKAHEPLNVRT